MKPTPNSNPDLPPLLVFGAHPDDIEFGCGGVLALERSLGRPIHMRVCSRGEAGTYGTPEIRTAEANQAAKILGASLEFLELDGDAHLEIRNSHILKLARVIRQVKPAIVLAPTLVENQHPDHWQLARMVRDATRIARYGKIAELGDLPPHAIHQLFYYASALETEPKHVTPLFVDVSATPIIDCWKSAMEAHVSQISSRRYIELQITRARLHGLSAGVEYAIALFPNDAIVVHSLAPVSRGARNY